MSKLSLLFLFVLFIASCSKHASQPITPGKTTTQLLYAGTYWNLTAISFENQSTTQWLSEPINDYWGSYPLFTSIRFLGDSIKMTGVSYVGVGTFSVSGKTLTMTPTDAPVQASTITTLNNTTLVIQTAFTPQGFNDGVTPYYIAIGMRQTFTAGSSDTGYGYMPN